MTSIFSRRSGVWGRAAVLLTAAGCLLLLGCASSKSSQASDDGRTTPRRVERSADKPAMDPAEDALWRSAWSRLDQTESQCDAFDYHPDGGMQITWCHLLSLIGWEDFLRWAPQPIFLDGPHEAGVLRLQDSERFGHYNPEFVRWLGDHLIPAAADPEFRSATQALYDRWLRPLARIHWVVHDKLARDRACRDRELVLYERAMTQAQAGYYERWFFFMNDAFCTWEGDDDWFFDHGFDGGVSGNVVKSAVGFWLRRHKDGTQVLFHQALKRLLQTYDAGFIGH